jgi:hypothetical protein
MSSHTVRSTAFLAGQSEGLESLTTKFSQRLLNDSLTLRLNDLQQSEFRDPQSKIPAYRQAGVFGWTNFFMEDPLTYSGNTF